MHTPSVSIALGLFFAVTSQVAAQGVAIPEIAAEAQSILKVACHRCHGNDGTVEGGFSYVLDRQQLVSRKQIVPRDAAKSRLIRRVQSNEMPPEGETPGLTKQQIDVLAKWVDAGAPDFNKSQPTRKFISASDMIQSMAEDLQTRDTADRQFTRYLTLTHLYNAGRSDDELRSYYHGVTKLMNSLSWGRKVITPKLIGSPPTVLRLDIRDFKWSAAVWDKLADADPYGLVYPNFRQSKKLYEEAGCALPYVRGDWFVAAAARPPLYHEILQLPTTEKELEALLHVDVEENIRSFQVARAGFNSSAVSRNNRLIERHDSSYGYYWKSYDFAKNVDRQNLFSHPLGPGTTVSHFKHDGGELIFSLPNGFQGYLLVDAEGRRIDKGPTEIVSDPKQPDRAVENGLSCMSCHVRGMLPKVDQVRPHVQKNPGAFSRKELEAVLALYPISETFQALIEDDTAKFRKATESAGLPPAVSEPIKSLATLFETELDLPLASAEAGLKPEEFQALLTKSPALARELGSLQTTGGTVQRDTFANSFAALGRAAKLGSPLAKSSAEKSTVAKLTDATGKSRPGTGGNKQPLPKGAFRSTIVEFTDKASPEWIFKEAKVGALLLPNRGYAFSALPKEVVGGTLLFRDGDAGWLEPSVIRATKDGTVYAVIRWKEHGKIQVDEVTFVKFAREGWEEVDDDVKTNVDGPFDSRWKALRKNISAGDVILQLDTIDFGRRAVHFIFHDQRVAKTKSTDARQGSRPAANDKNPLIPKGAFQSTVLEFTDKAPANFIFKQAAIGTPIWSDKGYLIAKLPEKIVGGTVVWRDSGSEGWLPSDAVKALKDCKTYAIVRWKYLGKVEIDDVMFAKLEREGWEDAGEVKTTFPGGEDWRWKALAKDVPEGDVILQLDTVNWGKRAVFFVFK